MYINDKTMLLLNCDNFNDSSHYQNVAVQENCTVVDNGKFNKAIDFNNNGTLRYTLPKILSQKDLTIDFWVYLKNYSTYPTILSTNNKNSDSRGIYLDFKSNKLAINLTSNKNLVTSSQFPLTTWKHIAVTIENDNTVSLYIDGIKEVSDILEADIKFDEVLVGALLHNNGIDGSTYSKCIIDDLRITNAILFKNNFTPHTSSNRVNNVNIINSSSNKIEFNVDGVYDKIKLSLNNNLKQEYQNTSSNIIYNILTEDLLIGKNDIFIDIIKDNIILLTKKIIIEYRLPDLTNTNSIVDIINRFDTLANSCTTLQTTLKNSLINKGVSLGSNTSLTSLIDTVEDIHGFNIVETPTDFELPLQNKDFDKRQLSSTTETLFYRFDPIKLNGFYNIKLRGSNQAGNPGEVYVYINDTKVHTFRWSVVSSTEFQTISFQEYLNKDDVVKINYKTPANGYQEMMFIVNTSLNVYLNEF